MKRNRFATKVLGIVIASAFVSTLAFAETDEIEHNFAIVQAVKPHAKSIRLKGYEYFVTDKTEVLNDVGMPARLDEFEPMEVRNKIPNRETGTKVYFEANFEHQLLKLHIVREIPR